MYCVLKSDTRLRCTVVMCDIDDMNIYRDIGACDMI